MDGNTVHRIGVGKFEWKIGIINPWIIRSNRKLRSFSLSPIALLHYSILFLAVSHNKIALKDEINQIRYIFRKQISRTFPKWKRTKEMGFILQIITKCSFHFWKQVEWNKVLYKNEIRNLTNLTWLDSHAPHRITNLFNSMYQNGAATMRMAEPQYVPKAQKYCQFVGSDVAVWQ